MDALRRLIEAERRVQEPAKQPECSRENVSDAMATRKQLRTAILAHVKQRGSKGPRKKRMRPEPRQYILADLDRARDRVEAAERRVESDRTNKPHRGRAGLKRARLELRVIESNLRARGLF